ncbi:MAG TPA: pentapeptide repeat-containing protein [Lacipirellulaceae bacterium]|nr:pentapeptide repeat-containing protein [Lacipirellulaceae bacterium]
MAEFCRGFVYEYDVSARLTIEGNKIPLKGPRNGWLAAKLPSGEMIKSRSRTEIVRKYIRRSGMLAARNREKQTHLEELRKGRRSWNAWRLEHPDIRPVLSDTKDLKTVLKHWRLDGYDFSYTNLCGSNLRGFHLERANFHQAILAKADLSHAHLERANFCRADMYETDFKGAHLTRANLQGVQMTRTNFTGANLHGCTVYGSATWDLALDGIDQTDLGIKYKPVIGKSDEEELAVDGVDLASFIYFTLCNANLARVVNATTEKLVLILGRFSKRKAVLDEIAAALRKRDFIPVIFDFPRPDQRDLVETLMWLAGMSMFVIAEITNPRSTPLELQAIASNYAVPILPIIKRGDGPFGMFEGLRKFGWVHEPLTYNSIRHLKLLLRKSIIVEVIREAERLKKLKRNASAS